MKNLDNPLNSEERYLHGINVRLNVLIEMFSSFLDVYAEEEEIVTTNNEEEIETIIEQDEEEVEDMNWDTLFTKQELMDIFDFEEITYTKSMLKSELVELAKECL